MMFIGMMRLFNYNYSHEMASGVLLLINPLINMLIHHDHAVHTLTQVKQHVHAVMSKRKIEDIIEDSLPATSKDVYLKAWKDFMEFKNNTLNFN